MNSADRGEAVPRVVGRQPEDLAQGAGAAAASGSGGGSAFGGPRALGLDRPGAASTRPSSRRPAPSPGVGRVGRCSRSRRRRATAGRRRPPAYAAAWLVASSSAKRGDVAQRPGLDHLAVGQHDDLVAAPHRGQPVRDDDADPVAQQPLGGPLHPRLGDRVHPRGGLVEDHHLRVADQDPGERDQLLLPGGQHVAALAELGVDAVRQVGDPGGQAQLVERPPGPARAAPGRTARCSRPACRPGSRCAAARPRPTGAAPRRRGRRGRCRRGTPCRAARRRPG